jgi:hypothetical protein
MADANIALIANILLQHWDVARVKRREPASRALAETEYNGYAAHIYRLLCHHATAETVAHYLITTAIWHIRVRRSLLLIWKSRRTARRLVNLRFQPM